MRDVDTGFHADPTLRFGQTLRERGEEGRAEFAGKSRKDVFTLQCVGFAKKTRATGRGALRGVPGVTRASSESKGVDPSRPCEHNEGDAGRPTRPIDHPATGGHAIASARDVHEKVASTVGRPVADAVPFLRNGLTPSVYRVERRKGRADAESLGGAEHRVAP